MSSVSFSHGSARTPLIAAGSMSSVSFSPAVDRHCRSLVKFEVLHPQSPGKTLELNFIPEGVLYRLITRSQLQDFVRPNFGR